jgi:hypothetical protein
MDEKNAFEIDFPNLNFNNIKYISKLTSFHGIGRSLYQDTTTNIYYLHETESSYSDNVPDYHKWHIYNISYNLSYDKIYIDDLDNSEDFKTDTLRLQQQNELTKKYKQQEQQKQEKLLKNKSSSLRLEKLKQIHQNG